MRIFHINYTSAPYRWLLPQLLLLLLLLSGCTYALPTTHQRIPVQSEVHRFDLSARQQLRDLSNDLSVGKGGADTGIAVTPAERVEIFASGSASSQAGASTSGPDGNTACRSAELPEPALPCYAVIYSVSISGRAGVVGEHVDFVPDSAGNLFLGVNAPRQASISGSFHITVLTIPSGAVGGIWDSPDNGFTLQGTSITLAARAFAQQSAVSRVEFTAQMPGHAPISLCTEGVQRGDTYLCQWNLMLHNNYLRNGQVSFGFILYGRSGKELVNPDGLRSGNVRYVQTQPTDIYAGYAATDLNQAAAYTKVTGTWIVPQAHCAAGETSYSSIWVGMTGSLQNSKLAQTGADSDCQDGKPSYTAWWEMYPDPSVPILQTVNAGDHLTATVIFQRDQFQLLLDDPDEGWHFSIEQPGVAADTSTAECITEAPTVEDLITQKQSVAQLTNFGEVRISCLLNNAVPISSGPQDILYQMTAHDLSKATTSKLDPTGSTFTVQWHHR